MTKTLETNITSEKGDEKSSNITTPLNSNNGPTRKDKNSLYLIQYQKYFNKKLVIKYNIPFCPIFIISLLTSFSILIIISFSFGKII